MPNYGTRVGDKTKILSGPCRIFVKKTGAGGFTELGFQTEEGAKLTVTNTVPMVNTSDRSSPVLPLEGSETAVIAFTLLESNKAALQAVLGAVKDVSGKLTGGSQDIVECEIYLEGMSPNKTKVCKMGLYRAVQMGTVDFGTFRRGAERQLSGFELHGLADTTKDPAIEGDLWYYQEDVTAT